MSRKVVAIAAAAGVGAAALALAIGDALASDLTWDYAERYGATSVRNRPRGEFQSDGIRIGNYLVFPDIGFRTSVTRDEPAGAGHARTSVRYELVSAVEVKSQLSRHQLDFRAEGRAGADRDYDDLRYIDGKVQAIGRFDIDHRSSVFGEASYELRHADDLDDDQPLAARRPTPVWAFRSDAGYKARFGRIDAALGARYARVEYDPVETNGGALLDQSARDYAQLEPYLRLGLRLSPGRRIFGEVSGRHLENTGSATIDRDARGVRALAGVEMELSPLVKLTLAGGYMQQDYLRPGLVDVATPIYEARLDWYVTPLVTLTFSASRDVLTTTYGEASGRLTDSFGVRADYEMWRNLILSAEGGYKASTYIGEPRSDRIWLGRLGAEYLAGRHWLFTFSYEHQQLESSDPDFDRKLDKVMVGAKYRF